MFYIFNFYLGAIIGSFIYVCILRLPNNEDVIFKKSYCEICKTQIKWYYNIPLFSFVTLKGKSNCCNKSISIGYFIIEFIVGLLFLTNSFLFNNFQLLLIDFLVVISILIIVIDYNEKIIFDIFSYSLIFIGLIINYYSPNLNPFNISIVNSMVTIFISSTLFFLLQYFYKKIKKIEALGTGDILLIAGLTAWTGFLVFLYLLIISSIIGIFYYLLFNRKKLKDFQIPFGSALCFSFVLLLYSNKIINL